MSQSWKQAQPEITWQAPEELCCSSLLKPRAALGPWARTLSIMALPSPHYADPNWHGGVVFVSFSKCSPRRNRKPSVLKRKLWRLEIIFTDSKIWTWHGYKERQILVKPATLHLRWVLLPRSWADLGSHGEGPSSPQHSQKPGYKSWLWDLGKVTSPPEPQVSVYKAGVMTALLGGLDESIPEKSKEETRLAQTTSSANAIIHCHCILEYKNERQASV